MVNRFTGRRLMLNLNSSLSVLFTSSAAQAQGEAVLAYTVLHSKSYETILPQDSRWDCVKLQRNTRIVVAPLIKWNLSGSISSGGSAESDVRNIFTFSDKSCSSITLFFAGRQFPIAMPAISPAVMRISLCWRWLTASSRHLLRKWSSPVRTS